MEGAKQRQDACLLKQAYTDALLCPKVVRGAPQFSDLGRVGPPWMQRVNFASAKRRDVTGRKKTLSAQAADSSSERPLDCKQM
jgi:hypothetical protein